MNNASWPWDQLITELTGNWGWLLIISTLGCCGFIVMAISQFVKCLWTKNTTSLSKFYTIILPITNTLLTIFDILIFTIGLNDPNQKVHGLPLFNWSALLPAILNGLISAYGVMILKVKHVIGAKKHGMTELKYYEKYLRPKSMAAKKSKNKKK